MATMEEAQDDEIAVGIAEDVRMANLVAVELPLAVKPTERGIQAGLALIGGIEELSKVTADEERALKLHARPNDPLCRPLVAQRRGSENASFVFKVKRRRLRPKGDPGQGVGGEDTKWSIASVEAVGAVHTDFSFHSLADAQFLSCRPKDVGVEESIDEHIEAAAARSEPMELVPTSFLPSFTKVSQQAREEMLLRREKKDNAHVNIERGGLLVYHRFGEEVKHRTKNGNRLLKDAKEVTHMREQLEQKWGAGRLRGRKNRPSRFRKGITGHNEVREQQLLLVQKLDKLFEKQPMYFMRQIEHLLNDQPVWPIRDLVPAVAYYYCNGPWRSRWVRFGYRPEDHPSDRFEQLLEFRVSPAQLRVWADALDKKPNPPKPPAHKAPVTTAKTSSTPAPAAATTAAPDAGATTASPASAALGSKNTATATARNANTSAPAVDSRRGGGGGGGGGAKPEETSTRTPSDHNHEQSKPATAEGLLSGVASSTAGGGGDDDNSEEGVQVAEAEREEEEDGAASRSGGHEQGDGDIAAPGFGACGVVPDLWLTSKTKGRFASQVVLNGGMLSGRNRVLVRESPIREVQELALKSARLDRPGIVTGWWQQSTIDKFRLLTLQGLSSVVKFKKEQLAAAAAAAAAADASEEGQSSTGSSAAAAAAATAKKNPLPANMTREEFDKAMKDADKKVAVVKAPTATGGGAGDEAFAGGQAAKKNKGIWPGTGGRSGTGRGGNGPKKVAGRKRPAPGGGGGVVAGASKDVDAERARSRDEDSDDETETDSVNSSDLVEDTGDESWDSQNDDESSVEEEDEQDEEEAGEDSGGGGGGGEGGGGGGGDLAAADERAGDGRGGIAQPSDGGGAEAGAGGGTGRGADAPRKGDRSRRKNS
eukprot:g10767.t1